MPSAKLMARGALQSVCRYLPLYSGAGRIANSHFFSAVAGDDLTQTRISDGSMIIVDPQDMLGRVILYFGDQDRKISWVLRQVLRSGDHVVDVGANIGALSIMAGRAVGPSGRVVAVEPQPDLVERVRASCALNGMTNVFIHQVGLSDTDRIGELSVPGHNSGYGSLVLKYGPEVSGRTVPVSLRHAGAFLSETVGDKRLRLLKIDVEGHEASVMRGARDWLKENPADFVLFEVSSGKPLWSREEVQILHDLGYSFLGVPHVVFKMRLVSISYGDDIDALDIRDVLAYHSGAKLPDALMDF